MDRTLVIQQASDRLAEVLASTGPAARVPTCPDWTALDLIKHLTQVHDFWAAVIGRPLQGPQVGEYEEGRPELPDDRAELLALRQEATSALLQALSERDPEEPAWSWFPPDQTVGFTWRMQTHEATMHRVDAELTAGVPISPIADDVAAEGIDHAIDVMWGWVPEDVRRTPAGTVELVATDTGRRWLLRTFRWSGTAWKQEYADEPGVERIAAGSPDASRPADATVSGRVEDLDLCLWKRADRGLTRSGDEQALAGLQAVVESGMG